MRQTGNANAILNFKNNQSLTWELQGIFPRNLMNDPQRALDGMLVLCCFFCNAFLTPIEFDMETHLLEAHRKKLVTDLPLRGKGFNMDYRILFAIDIMKRMKPLVFYNHRTTKFASKDNPQNLAGLNELDTMQL
jgi:hypothetical protein